MHEHLIKSGQTCPPRQTNSVDGTSRGLTLCNKSYSPKCFRNRFPQVYCSMWWIASSPSRWCPEGGLFHEGEDTITQETRGKGAQRMQAKTSLGRTLATCHPSGTPEEVVA